MSGDSSLGIGIGLALKSYGRGLTYVKTDRALDLGNLEPFTIPDLSGNANTATLYTGIYVSTNGTTDKAIGANATALGSGNYYLTGKIKPAGTTAKTTMNGSTASNLTGLTAGVWQDFQTATASAITPGSINLGWDGTAFNTTVDNWSDVKLHDASDDSVVAHYKLYDSADASLDGYPALDCVGGFHGTYTGCASGSGEGVDADVAGISATLDDKMWFDEVDDNLDLDSNQSFSGAFTWSFKLLLSSTATAQVIFADSSVNNLYVRTNVNASVFEFRIGGSAANVFFDSNLESGTLYDIQISRDISDVITVVVDGVTQSDDAKTLTGTFIVNRFGMRNAAFNPLGGLLYDVNLGNGLEWDGTIADGNTIGTVNGSPVTVGQKRDTILQTAGEDFNLGGDKEVIYNQATDGLTGIVAIGGAALANQTIGGETDAIKFTIDSSTGVHRIHYNFDPSLLNWNARVELQVYVPSSNTVVDGIIVNNSGVNDFITSTPTQDSWVPLSGTSQSIVGSQIRFNLMDGAAVSYAGNGTDTFYLRVIVITQTLDATHFIPESETTAGQDALGNAIENPRPNERVLNLTTGTGYAEVADSASLDLTTAATWELWGNFADKQTNNQEAYLAKYNAGGNKRSWNIAYNPVNQNPDEISMAFGDPSDGTFEGLVKISVPNEIASVVFTYNNGTLVAYVNGSSVGTTVVTGSVPVTLHQNNEPVLVGSSGDDLPAATLIGDIRIYDSVLTAAEVLKNYQARKSAYGL